MKVLNGLSSKAVKLPRSKKRNSAKGKRSRNKPKTRKKIQRAVVSEQQESIDEEATIKRVTKLLGDVSVESLPDFEEDANVFQDLDLMILGSSREEYTKYTELLRREYSHLDDANYKKMRLKILQTFLMIPTLYLTPEFHKQYEEAARKNINQEIEELKK